MGVVFKRVKNHQVCICLALPCGVCAYVCSPQYNFSATAESKTLQVGPYSCACCILSLRRELLFLSWHMSRVIVLLLTHRHPARPMSVPILHANCRAIIVHYVVCVTLCLRSSCERFRPAASPPAPWVICLLTLPPPSPLPLPFPPALPLPPPSLVPALVDFGV